MPSKGGSRAARIAGALEAMPPEVRRFFAHRRTTDPYGGCECDKQSWRSEQLAIAARTSACHRGHYPDTARVYKCPATSRWHIATRGFHPDVLKSRNRIVAWHLWSRGLIDLAEITRREFGMTSWKDNKRFKGEIAVMNNATLTCWDRDRPGYLAAVDKPGLFRVCEIGLREYLIERYAPAEGRPGQDSNLRPAV